MLDNRKRILIVDDTPGDIHILMELLKDYAILAATSGEKALKVASESQPDIILLDVMMPEMDGYQTCRHLKEHPNTKNIDVIFISAHDTTEEKLKGYEAGGNDYLIKPVQPEELLHKITRTFEHAEKQAETEENANSAMKTAMTAMTSMGELGFVQEFMRNSYKINKAQELATLVIEALTNYGLESCIQLCSPNSVAYASNQPSIAPIEKELLKSIHGAVTLFDKGPRFIVNYGETSLLVKNMPKDEDKRGRLRDHIASLIEAADARLKALVMQQAMINLVDEASRSLEEIETTHKQQKTITTHIADEMLQQLAILFSEAGLTESQENNILDFVGKNVERLLNNMESSHATDEMLKDITVRLKNFSS